MLRQKSRYMRILLLLLMVIITTITMIWAVAYGPLSTYRKLFLGFMFIYIITLLAVLAVGILAIMVALWRGRSIPLLQAPIVLVISMMVPFFALMGRWLGADGDKIKKYFIEANNFMTRSLNGWFKPEEIMLVAPHCLQNSACDRKITGDINNCNRCSRCQVSELIDLAERLQVTLVIATGGTFARKFIKDHKPKIVVAIACERDLSSGIQETYPLPVLGVLNMRPNGPCLDTRVDLEEVEQTVTGLLTLD